MYESNKKKLDELYNEDSKYIDKQFDQFVKLMRISVDRNKNLSKNILDELGIKNKDVFSIIMICLLFIIFGAIILLPTVPQNFLFYLFGFVFFIAGFGVAILAGDTKGSGIIFYFSHGATGYCIMTYSIIAERFNTAIFSDLSNTLKIYLGIIAGLILVGILYGIIYNLSDTLKLNKFNKVFLLLLFFVSIILIGCLPFIPF